MAAVYTQVICAEVGFIPPNPDVCIWRLQKVKTRRPVDLTATSNFTNIVLLKAKSGASLFFRPHSPKRNMVTTKIDIKQELRSRLQEALHAAKDLPPMQCRNEIRKRLTAIQRYCRANGKTFIFIEQRITCDEFDLMGDRKEKATLFRGPSEDASVAICITDKGSLLHRNDFPWRIYRDKGDINSEQCLRVKPICIEANALNIAAEIAVTLN